MAYIVESTYRNNILKAKIPDILLTQPYPIFGYVYYETDKQNKTGIGQSIISFKINVRKRPKPSDIIHSNSNDYLSYYKILEDCSRFITEEDLRAEAELIRIEAENNRIENELLRREREKITDLDDDKSYTLQFVIDGGFLGIKLTEIN